MLFPILFRNTELRIKMRKGILGHKHKNTNIADISASAAQRIFTIPVVSWHQQGIFKKILDIRWSLPLSSSQLVFQVWRFPLISPSLTASQIIPGSSVSYSTLFIFTFTLFIHFYIFKYSITFDPFKMKKGRISKKNWTSYVKVD